MEYTPDGRSLITTTGERRFKVVARSIKDGYNCAKIRFVYDEPVTDTMEIGKRTAAGLPCIVCVCVTVNPNLNLDLSSSV